MIRWIYLILLFVTACNRPVETSVDSVEVTQHKPVFWQLPFARYDDGNIPRVEVEIQGRKYSMIFDLGAPSDLELISPLDEQIVDKEFLRTSKCSGMRGKVYECSLYRIAKACVGGVYVHDPMLRAVPVRLVLDGYSSMSNHAELEHGSIGWRLFERNQLLVDRAQNQAIIMRGLEGMAENGYDLNAFIQIPMQLDRGSIDFEAEVNGKICRCTLDTGCTWNYYPLTARKNRTIDEVDRDIGERASVPLQIAGCDMGLLKVRNNAFDPTLGLQVILGMEFFQEHVVVVDFPGKRIYFSQK